MSPEKVESPGAPPGAHRTVLETLAAYGSSQQVWMLETLPFRLVPDPLPSREALRSSPKEQKSLCRYFR